MALKCVTLLMVSFCFALHCQAASSRNPRQEAISAFYLKDSNSGILRFLGAGFGNAQINQIITNKQDYLEQLRPNFTTSTGTGPATAIDSIVGVKPIIIRPGSTGSTSGMGVLGIPIFSVSPIQVSLPPRGPNRRRPARRGVKRNGNKKAQFYVIRPKD